MGCVAESPEWTDDRLARLRLARLTEPGDQKVGALVAQRGAETLVSRIDSADQSLVNVNNYRARLRLSPEADIEQLDKVGGRFVIPGDHEWPSQLGDLGYAAPLGLFVVGTPVRLAALRSVAIVGSRAATDYGSLAAGDLAHDLACRRWTVVSGGAVGIDAAAHRGALVASGTTIAVLACGIDVAYPQTNAGLFDRIATSGGCLVSELPPESHPTKPRFLQRNRVIAAITRGTVVVEAAHRSGALNTASYCRSVRRRLMAVPGPITSAMSAGSHRLLRDDEPARLVTSADEVIEEVGLIGDLAPPASTKTTIRDGLDSTSLRVLEAVAADHSMSEAAITEAAGLAKGTVSGALLRLSAMGLVTVDGDIGYRLVWGEADRPRAG